GNVLLEAMASGLPVVAAESGPTREVLAAGGGVTTPAGDPEALAAMLVALAADPARRTALAHAGQASAAARSWGRSFDGLLEDYVRVVAEHAAARALERGSEPHPSRTRRVARVRLRARIAARALRREAR
ncbi:MAG TPA: glycosyltransferase, partial [Gemmatimonadaceae bacterium]|nr:glycosyltransferase [Gemmatimonadaceae bacterium]